MMKSCWHDDKTTPREMIAGAEGKLWPKLKHSDHALILKELISKSGHKNVLDLGCGAAELSTILPTDYSYSGADLPHIIDLVAKKIHPNLSYIKCDIEKDSMAFLEQYDLIVMNALIDVLKDPIIILGKILSVASSHVLIHRQSVKECKTTIIINESYGGETYKSILNKTEFEAIIKNHGFKILEKRSVLSTEYSFLLGQ